MIKSQVYCVLTHNVQQRETEASFCFHNFAVLLRKTDVKYYL